MWECEGKCVGVRGMWECEGKCVGVRGNVWV